MSAYTFAIGDSNTIYCCTSGNNSMKLIGTFILNEQNDNGDFLAILTPLVGNVHLTFEENDFLTLLKSPTELDVFFSGVLNYKLVQSFTKTVLTNALLTMPCPYVDHKNIFPSMQELIDILIHKHNVKFYAIIPLNDDNYKVYIYEEV